MAFEQINDYSPGATDLENVTETVDVQRRGKDFIVLTNWDSGNTAEPEIEIGSVLEFNGSLYELKTANLSIGSTPVSSGTYYIEMTVSGSNILANWTSTVPTWDTAKGGWFVGSDKYLPFVVDFDGVSTWENKNSLIGDYLDSSSNIVAGYAEIGEQRIGSKVIELGSWNINGDSVRTYPHGLSKNSVISVETWIRNDDDDFLYSWNHYNTITDITQGSIIVSDVHIELAAESTGLWVQSTQFDETGFNRGFIYIKYLY